MDVFQCQGRLHLDSNKNKRRRLQILASNVSKTSNYKMNAISDITSNYLQEMATVPFLAEAASSIFHPCIPIFHDSVRSIASATFAMLAVM